LTVWLKGPEGGGEWRISGSFPFDKLGVRMTARTGDSNGIFDQITLRSASATFSPADLMAEAAV
jgi:hypothetical protein